MSLPHVTAGAAAVQRAAEQRSSQRTNLSPDSDFHVTTRYTITGTHDGDLTGTPPSGKDVAFTGITISRCENGRIAEEWEITDAVGLLGQIGALPAMAQN